MSSLLIPLGGTVVAQAAAAMLLFALPVLGPVLTEMLGIAPERIGLLTAASSFGTVWFMTVSRLFLDRFGPRAMRPMRRPPASSWHGSARRDRRRWYSRSSRRRCRSAVSRPAC
jgi:MFS family permease